MSAILVDTSMWIEFFSSKPKVTTRDLDLLESRITEDEVVIIQPIRAELLSGNVQSHRRNEVKTLLSSIKSADLDWNLSTTWDEIIALGDLAKSVRMKMPGVVDRMIILAAIRRGAEISSLDHSLMQLFELAKASLT